MDTNPSLNTTGPQPAKRRFHWLFLPVLVLLTLCPLAARITVIQPDSYTAALMGNNLLTDVFAQSKARVIAVMTVVMVAVACCFFRKLFLQQKRDRLTLFYAIAMGVYLLFTLLSAAFSPYSQVAWGGLYSRAEGFFTLACYVVIFLYTLYAYRDSRDIRYLVYCLMVVVGINAVMGIFQYFGNDFYTTPVGAALITPQKYDDIVTGISLLFESGKMHGTFFHYNYVGSYVALIIPLFLVLLLALRERVQKLALGVFAVGAFWMLFGSTSRGGLMGVAAALVLAVVLFSRQLLRYWKTAAVFGAALVVAVIGINIAAQGKLFERIPSLVQDILSLFDDTSDFNYLDHIPVRDIQTQEDGSAVISLQGDEIRVSYDGTDFSFQNAAGEELPYQKEGTGLVCADPAYADYSFLPYASSVDSSRAAVLVMNVQGKPFFPLGVGQQNQLVLVNLNTGMAVDTTPPPAFGFRGKERLGSARGYIWSRGIPLMKDHLLLGSGPDTFLFEFPQEDLFGKYYAYDTPNMVVDKAHNLYLATFVNQGGVAFLAMAAVLAVYVVDSLRLYAFKGHYTTRQFIGVAMVLSVVGYLVAGVFNDSVVDVAPLFWALLAIGITTNSQIRCQGEEEPQEE